MRTKRLSDRNFGLMFGLVFGVIALVAWLVNGSRLYWAAAIAVAFLVAALLSPLLLMPLNRLWERLGHRLSFVTNGILLGAFLYLVMTPFGILVRVISGDPMRRKFDATVDSYFTPVARQTTSETLRDMF